MFSWFQPAKLAHSIPLVGRVAKLVGFKQPAIEKTTEQGAAGTAAPSLYQFSLLSQRYERQSIIADIRKLLQDDTRLAKANRKFAREAVRKGVVVTVIPKPGTAEAIARQAQEIVDGINQAAKINSKLLGWARMLLAEGDAFLQIVVLGDRIINVKRMPAASMERNTDETDSFPDLSRAFTQFDVATQQDIAHFAHWQIAHLRWNYIDGERYGESEYLQLRLPGRRLDLVEQAQAVRRLTRAPQRRLHKVGTPDKPAKATGEGSVQEYREMNGLINKPNDVWKPLTQVTDYYSNGLTSIETLPGDPNIHEIDDIKHYQDVYMAGTSTPKALIGIDAESINRDVLEDQRGEFLKETVALSDCLGEGLREIYELGLLLAGINPAAVELVLRFSESNMESPSTRAERVVLLRKATLGDGRAALPSPLVSQRTALQILAEDLGTSPQAELEAILEEQQEARAALKELPAQGVQTDGLDARLASSESVQVVVVAVTDPQGRLLVVRRSPGENRAGEWEVPGGHVDPGESVEAAAIREVKEETGFDVVLGNGIAEFRIRETGARGVMVRGYLVGGKPALKLDEHDRSRWIAPEEASKLSPTPPRFVENVRQVLAAPIYPA